MTRSVAPRHKYTIYPTEDLQRALERAYHERCMTDPLSKQEFLDEILWTGLRTRAKSRLPIDAAVPPVTPPAPTSKNRPVRAGQARSAPPVDPLTTPRAPRMSAMEQLKARTAPGRPAPIVSAADDPAEETNGVPSHRPQAVDGT